MNKAILFEESAVRIVLKELKKQGYKWKNLEYVNKGRYCIVYGEPNIAILLKTKPFKNFGYQFRHLGAEGVGDSINSDMLKLFVRKNIVKVYTQFRDGKLYVAELMDILRESFSWQQKEGTEVRSYSIHLYKRVN